MKNAVVLHAMIRRNQQFVKSVVSGFNQDDILLQLAGNSNCMNWVLGHIAVYRDAMLAWSKQGALLTEPQRATVMVPNL